MHLSPWLHFHSLKNLHMSPGCWPRVIPAPTGQASVGVRTLFFQCTRPAGRRHAVPRIPFLIELQSPLHSARYRPKQSSTYNSVSKRSHFFGIPSTLSTQSVRKALLTYFVVLTFERLDALQHSAIRALVHFRRPAALVSGSTFIYLTVVRRRMNASSSSSLSLLAILKAWTV